MPNRITPGIAALKGRTHGPYRVAVEAGAIRRFAEAIGDPSPAYRGESPIVPPTFPATFRPEGDYPDVPADFGDVGLHASQSYEFERPLRAGDVLDVSFTVTDIYEKGGRSGDLVFIERTYEFTDARTGARAGGGKWVSLRRFDP
ncbi:MAG: MaoC family dehydratase N-terminal domain-containing protein [Candidatus Tectomicrobia bacterium]|uniref:MaoC family dehydratase N-terminal domain-containing protein n=1 Tax=Tectimicrobiota bacterium TaxID=2528274 RepID=A0A932MLY1_UNCTE|nr:MaoC family dehydratase N-terminal domain-containing protein [Candidatus Tectomicrobia bacterium]